MKPFKIDFKLTDGYATSIEIIQERFDKNDLHLFIGTSDGKVIRYDKGYFSVDKTEFYSG